MSFKQTLENAVLKSTPRKMNELGNGFFAASIGAYQLYGQFVLNPTTTSLAVLGTAATLGVAAEIIYLVHPIIKKDYPLQIK